MPPALMVGDRRFRVGFVVQRYGRDVNGGAEAHCRMLAERLARRSEVKSVTVFTSCAIEHDSWANAYPPGAEQLDGVRVERFPVSFRRLRKTESLLGSLTMHGPKLRSLEGAWVAAQGPFVPKLVDRLAQVKADYDAFVFFTYLHYPTVFGLPKVAERSVFVPTAHDERQISQHIYTKLFSQARAFAFNTPEERDFVYRRFAVGHVPARIVGCGVDLPERGSLAQAQRRSGIDAPFVLYLGRLTKNKGVLDLMPALAAFKRKNGDRTFRDAHGSEYRGRDLKLVLVGRRSRISLPKADDLVELGFVDDERKQALLADCELLVLPSRLESMSLVVLEAWAHGKPVLVERRCAVTSGLAARSHGGLAFEGPRELADQLAVLLADPARRRALGEAGQRYVSEEYNWQRVEASLLESDRRDRRTNVVVLSALFDLSSLKTGSRVRGIGRYVVDLGLKMAELGPACGVRVLGLEEPCLFSVPRVAPNLKEASTGLRKTTKS